MKPAQARPRLRRLCAVARADAHRTGRGLKAFHEESRAQRPEELPVDLAAELQIAGVDRVAIECRRWLREIAKGSDAARQAAEQ